MLFMCRLSDGSDHTTRYALSSDLTALEESLRNIDLMESILGKDHADTINALRISIKKQVRIYWNCVLLEIRQSVYMSLSFVIFPAIYKFFTFQFSFLLHEAETITGINVHWIGLLQDNNFKGDFKNPRSHMELLYGNNILSYSTDWKSKMATISLQTAQPCSK